MQNKYIEIRHVSNAGLVLTSDSYSIGIDCFCRDTSGRYEDTPEELREELLREVQYDKLNVLIFTHEHEDHFCVEDVKAALKRNAGIKIYAGNRVRTCLLENGVDIESIRYIDPWKCTEELYFEEIETFHIGFMNTLHDGKRYTDVSNLCLLIKVNGLHIVVVGDARPCEKLFKDVSYWSSEIDCFFAPFPYVGLSSVRKKMSANLNIKQIIVLHQPRKEADLFNWIESTKKVCKTSKDRLPNAIFPEKIGITYCI